MTVGLIGLIPVSQGIDEVGLQPEQLGLLLSREVVQVCVVDDVETALPAALVVHASYNLFAKLLECIVNVHGANAVKLAEAR